MTEDVGRRARSSIKIMFAGTVVQGLTQAVVLVVLARLLSPAEYGFYALALSISLVTTGLVSNSFERALVVSTDDNASVGRALPILLTLLGVSAAVVGIATLVARTSGWQVSIPLVAILCASQALAGFGVASRVALRRRLAFGRIMAGEVIGQLVGGGLVAILLAGAGWGAYALAAGFAVQTLTSLAILLSARTGGVTPLRFGNFVGLGRSAFELGKVGALEIVHVQLPALLLGTRFGPAPLGLFNRVSNLITLPLQLLTSSMSRVMMSALVAVSDDKARLARATGGLMRVSTALITPLAFGIAGSGATFVETVLGPQWTAAVPLVPILAIATWAALTAHILAILAEAMRQFRQKIQIQFATTLVLVVGILVGSGFGLTGAAFGVAAGSLVFLVLNLWLATRLLELPLGEILRWMASGLVAGAACFGVARLIGVAVVGEPPVVLAAQVVGCGMVAIALYLLLDRTLLTELRRALMPGRKAT